jgi:ribosome biogenesis protein ERB1
MAARKNKSKLKEKQPPPIEDEVDDESSASVYDSEAEEYSEEEVDEEYDSNAEGSDDEEDDNNDDESDGDEFEDQGSSDDEDEVLEKQIRRNAEADDDSEDELEIIEDFETVPRAFAQESSKRSKDGRVKKGSSSGEEGKEEVYNDPAVSKLMHTDDLSSDDEDADGEGNRIGRVPLHWYDEYDHIGYNAHGTKIIKQSAKGNGGDLLDQALQNQDDLENKRYIVHDALNDKDVQLSERQLEIIRRIQGGAFAHPEHNANPDYIAYFSGVDKEISGIGSNRYEPKARFQPSKYEKAQVRQLLKKLKDGKITMDYLTGKVRDMNDVTRKEKREDDKEHTYLMWKGDEEDELNLRKGPMHIAAPKVPPPTHADSYNPPDEYLPTEEDLKEWEDMEVKDRPHGLLIPKKFKNLRSVGAYEHAVRERFERCLDLYLCPRVMKRRLNIDPESLVPSLPKASDLRPFPTSKCIEFETPYDSGSPPMIRCLTVSPDGQFLASGASDGYVRLWEVQTGRLLRSWNVSKLVDGRASNENDDIEEKEDSNSSQAKAVVSIEWNPNRSHHCLLAGLGKCAVIIATGTGGPDDAELTDALLSSAASCTGDGANVKNAKAKKSVTWKSLSNDTDSGDTPISAFGGLCGPIVALYTNKDISHVKWHKKGDYFVTVSPKAQAAAVLIHQLNKATSQQPFSKNKGGEVQKACFHPNKPFLFVATKEHIKIYHLVKQTMVKRLLSGCRWISSIDIHPSGDHVIVGSLDRRMVWFDLDLSATPYKTLKYHEKALRHVGFHPRYPLMASSSDDGSVHVFHSMVYSDLMRNPLVVPVKILRGHSVVDKLGVISFAFHPTQPWLFSAGADGKIHLYQDI